MAPKIAPLTLLLCLSKVLLCLAQDYSIEIVEEKPPGTLVFDVNQLTNSESSAIIVGSANNAFYEAHFSYDADERRIITKGSFDRESMVDRMSAPNPVNLTLHLLVDYVSYEVLVKILDLNDNQPTFKIGQTYPGTEYSTSITEGIPIQVSLFWTEAQDYDEGLNGTTHYILEQSSPEYFNLSFEYTPSGRVSYVYVMNILPLDRETNENHTFTITATEGIANPASTTLYVTIHITDIDDHPPQFVPTQYAANISEASPTEVFVVGLNVYDPDLGTNADITYNVASLCGRETDSGPCTPINLLDSPFALDSESGIMTLSGSLNYESTAKYLITVEAFNPSNLPGGSATAIISVDIEDVNDEAPQFTEYKSIITIPENTQAYSGQINTGFVGEFRVEDADSEIFSNFMVVLLDSETMMESTVFGLQDSNSYYEVIILLQTVDRETKDQYDITVRATDVLDQSLSTELNITIKLSDINDNPPVFQPYSMPVVLKENSVIGTAVLYVNATDEDIGSNGMVRYSLPENSADFPYQSVFNIEQSTGLVKVQEADSIDYEVTPEMWLLVIARDLNGAGMSANVEINITVTDVNDNFPVIVPPDPVISISEATLLGTEILDIDATDVDSNTVFVYKLMSVSNIDIPFSIDGEGQITVTGSLDREERDSYEVEVSVGDGENTVQTNIISIIVTDVNDSPPEFVETILYANVVEDAPISTIVKTVTATDNDTAEMTSITYSIIAGNNDGHFAVNQEGAITVYSALDWEAGMSYTLQIQAYDSSLLSENDAIINIMIIDVNDEVPVFTQNLYSFNVAEDNSVNVLIGMVEAVSIEEGTHGEMRYSIIDGYGLPFAIDEITGKINATQTLDREVEDSYLFQVKVEDVAPPPHFNTTHVNIIVTDINDNSPVFAVSSLSLNLTERTAKGDIVYTAQATDDDLPPNNQIVYSVSKNDHFSIIHSSSGQLVLQNSLNYDSSPSVTLVITATDAANSAYTDTLTLDITVIEDEETNITFPDSFPTQLSVSEDTPINTPLIEFSGEDQHGVPKPDLNYFLTNEDGSEVQEFGISYNPFTNNATIRTILTLDREIIPLFTLRIVITDNTTQNSVTQILTVDLLDINDNQPLFLAPSYQFSVDENKPGMASIQSATVISVVDPDNGVNGSVTFSLKTPSAYFGLLPKQGYKAVTVYQLLPLDREEVAQHNITIVASDQGNPSSLPSEVLVTINVMDKNDNSPTFSPLAFTVSENKPVGYIVGTLSSSDLDEGSNAQVTFHVEALSTAVTNFKLHPNGTIQIINIPDFEEQSEYIFFITAEDGGNPSQSTYGNVTISVQDVNDHCPYFEGGPLFVVDNFAESNEIGSTVINLTAVDPDTGAAGVVQYAFANMADRHLFDLDTSTGVLSLMEKLDYEINTQHTIEIVAYDLGKPINHVCNATVTINVLNVNEHTPAFDKLIYEISVNENISPGVISNLLAYDLDADSSLTYAISELDPGIGSMFTVINSQLSTVSKLNYESKSKYLLMVNASDGTNTGQAEYVVYINNINDNDPMFNQTSYSGSVSELAALDTPVLAVRATDADNNTNAAVVYSITGDSSAGMFSIDSNTGMISVQGSLDYEHTSSYTLTVTATDTGTGPRSATVSVTVLVINENEFSPVFTKSIYAFTVTEESGAGVSIGQVNATDEDKGEEGVVSYSLLTSTDVFTIDSNTGTISTAKPVDRESTPTLPTLLVQASSSGMTDMATVEITVLDINDNPPIFSNSVFNFEIYPTHVPEAAIGTVYAEDSDVNPNDVINYIISPETLFAIDSSSGELSLIQSLPSDHQNSYDLIITAIDAGNPAFLSDTIARVHIVGENDHPPKFADSTISVNVTEETIPSEPIATLLATDEDTGSNGVVSYSIIGNYPQFSIESSGHLTVVQPLDYEDTSTYYLTIRASDSTPSKARTATSIVMVTVLNTNDNDPEFVSSPSMITLSPVPYPNVRLFQVTAGDQDGDSVSYVVLSQTMTFGIDSTSGWVVNKQALVAEASYSVDIRALDTDSRADDTTITVVIANLSSSEAPSFTTDNPFPLVVSESTNMDLPIHTFSAINAQEYHLVCCGADLEPFLLDAGKLTLSSMLDYETKTQYQLIVEARKTPSVGVRYSDYLQVNVIVQNVNEYDPVFINIMNPISIKENSVSGTLLTQVTATDADAGSFGDVQYEIVGGNTGGAFQIDPTNGAITVTSGVTLDREMVAFYYLLIKAVDGGGRLSSELVEVTIQDENDSPATFPGNYSIGVFEPGSVNDLVFTIQADDADSDSQITYSLGIIKSFKGTSGKGVVSSFTITGSTGEIRLAVTLDQENIDRYVLPVTATDNKHLTTTYVHISVMDINDNMPSFTVPHYEATMEELSRTGMPLQTAPQANDIDAGANGIVTYSLGEGWPENKFTIDPYSGKIRVKEPIGYFELLDTSSCPSADNPSFTGTVVATDSGNSPHSASATITVTIVDINDSPPLVQGSPFSLKVSRSAPVGQVITELNVVDADCGPNIGVITGLPEYYFQPSKLFVIADISVGQFELLVKAALTEGIYRFRFIAYNNNPYPQHPYLYLGSYTDFKVEVLPDNEHAPIFSDALYQDYIYENNVANVVVLTVLATDNDLGETGRVTYSIDSTDVVPFEVDEDTGTVSVLEMLDREEKDVYQFVVLATDHGFPARSSQADVEIKIFDLNDNSPKFLSTHYEGEIWENSLPGEYVLTVTATDPDLESAGIVQYLIPTEDQTLPFTIDQNTGVITTKGNIDYEETSMYLFTVKATDKLNSPKSSSVSVTISVQGENEFGPSFPSNESYVFYIPSTATRGDDIGRVNATDKDGGNDGHLVYHINAGDGTTYFNISTDSNNQGIIILNISPQQMAILTPSLQKREAEEETVIVTITASDMGPTPKSATVTATMVFPPGFLPLPILTDDFTIYYIAGAVAGACLLLLTILIIFVCIAVPAKMRNKKGKMVLRGSAPSPQVTELANSSEQVGLELRQISQPTEINEYSMEPTAAIPAQTQLPRGRGLRNNMEEVDFCSAGSNLSQSPNHRPSPHTRSTSDLASTVATDILTQDALPYNKAQIEAIYAANANLLNDGSQDSVHMFGSEGGGEADGDVDIDNMVFTKYDLDTEGSVAGGDDTSYCNKRRSMVSVTSEGGKEDEYHFSQATNPWSSRPGSISRGMNELDRAENSRPMMYHYDMSQGPSGFGASTQGSSASLLRTQRRYAGSDRELHYPLPPSHSLPPPVEYFPDATLATPLPSLGPPTHSLAHHHIPHQYNLPLSRPSYQYRPSPMNDYSNSGSDGPPPPYFSQDLPYALPHSYGQTSGNYFHGHQTPPPEHSLATHRPLRAYEHPMLSNSSNSLSSTSNSNRGGSRSYTTMESFH